MGAFIRYVSLNVAGMVGLSCYILVDTLFVSLAVGSTGLAALNLSITVYSVIAGAGLLCGVGGATDFSLRRARGEENPASFTQALCCAAALSAAFTLTGLFLSAPLSRLLGAQGATFPLTYDYVRTLLLFSPAFLLNATLQAFVRNDGAPRLAMFSMLLSSFSNIALDYVFMFPLGMGMFGAALATGLAALMSAALLCSYVLSRRCSLRPVRCGLHGLWRLLSYGVSSMIGELASAVSLFTFNLLLLSIGGYLYVAAYGVVANTALVATSIFTGVGQGIQPLVSHACGSGQQQEMRRLLRATLLCAGCLAAVLFAAVFVFAQPIAAAFDHEDIAQLRALAVSGLRLYFCGYFFAGVNIAAAAYLSAVGRPGRALLISLLRSCVLLVPAAILLGTLFGADGVFLSFAAAELAVFLISAASLLRLGRGRTPSP